MIFEKDIADELHKIEESKKLIKKLSHEDLENFRSECQECLERIEAKYREKYKDK